MADAKQVAATPVAADADQFASLLQRFPGDGPSALFVRRCDTMLSAPPSAGWDGVFQMQHK